VVEQRSPGELPGPEEVLWTEVLWHTSAPCGHLSALSIANLPFFLTLDLHGQVADTQDDGAVPAEERVNGLVRHA